MRPEPGPENPASVRFVADRLTEYIDKLGSIWVEGQVAQFRPRPGASFQFFTLRDLVEDMSVSVMIPEGRLARLEPRLEPGQRVVVHAKPNYWKRNGSLSLRADEVRAVGLGELLAQLARLKEALGQEGLFAPERKQPLPFLPRRIGLICGRASDAMHDVLANANDRWPGIPFEIREVPVQGPEAASAVIAALQELDDLPAVDVIIITRGGGSMEDLLPFSAEALVRTVSAARTPVVSAIGHEQDTPLLDFVADFRASTPTDAAKRVVPSHAEQSQRIADLRQRSQRAVAHMTERAADALSTQQLRMRSIIQTFVDRSARDLSHMQARLRTLSPQATLDRGYAIALTAAGHIIRDETHVRDGERVDIRVASGRFWATREGDDIHE